MKLGETWMNKYLVIKPDASQFAYNLQELSTIYLFFFNSIASYTTEFKN